MKRIIIITLMLAAYTVHAQKAPGYQEYIVSPSYKKVQAQKAFLLPMDTVVAANDSAFVHIAQKGGLTWMFDTTYYHSKYWHAFVGITQSQIDSWNAKLDSFKVNAATDVDTSGIADGDVLVWSVPDGKFKLEPQSGGIDSLQSQYSIVGSGKASNKFRLANDSSISENTTPLAYQYVNGRPGFYPVKADTADIFGIDSSTTFANITELRATQLYNKGARYAITMGYTTRNDGGGTRYIWNAASTAADDGKFVFKPDAIDTGSPGRWEWMAKGVVRAAEVGVKSDGTDQTSTLNALFSLSTVKDVVFDNGDVTIAGKVDGQGKKMTFSNAAKIKGVGAANADTLTNIYVSANPLIQIFDTSLAVTKLYAEKISVRWFGALGTATNISGSPDDYPAFNRALLSGRVSYDDGILYGGIKRAAPIYIPAADSGRYYFLSQTINAANYGAIHIEGEGTFNQYSGSRIVMGTNKSFFTTGTQPNCKIENLFIQSLSSNNDTAHGVFVNAHVELKNINVNAFYGDGFHLEGQLPNNLNGSKYYDLTATNCHGNGVYVNGADANAMVFYNLNITDNYKWGVWESSFLGNTYVGCHTDNNGRIYPYVDYGGSSWWIYNDAPAGIKPGVTSGWGSYYEYLGASQGYPAWDSTKTYQSGGGYKNDDANARSVFMGCYAESNQPPNYFSGPCTVIGGLMENDFSKNTTGVVIVPNQYNGTARFLGAIKSQNNTLQSSPNIYSTQIDSLGISWGLDGSSFRPKMYYNSLMDRVNMTAGGRMGFGFVGQSSNTGYNSGGRDSALNPSTPVIAGAAAFTVPDVSGRLNILGFRGTKPSAADPNSSSGDYYSNGYVVGDLFLNSGTDTTLVGWRCISSGNYTTSVWREIRTGSGSGTGLSGLTTNGVLVASSSTAATTPTGLTYTTGEMGMTGAGTLMNTATVYSNLSSVGGVKNSAGFVFGTMMKPATTSNNLYKLNYSSNASSWVLARYDRGISIHTGYSAATGTEFGETTNERFRVDNNGHVIVANDVAVGTGGIADALLKLGIGTTTVAPLKFTSGLLLTTPQNGAVEYTGTHLYVTIGSTRYQLDQQFTTPTLDQVASAGNSSGSVLKYNGNYGSLFDARTLVDRGYTDSARNKARDSVVALIPTNAVQPKDSNTLYVTPHALDSAMNTAGGVRTLSSQYTDAANSGTTETDLMSYSVPGGTLANDGDYIEFDAVFSYAANANGKTLAFKFGGSMIHTYSAGSVTSSGGDVIVHGKIIRTGATTQRGFITFEPMFGTKSYSYQTGTETLSGAVTLKFTGTSDTASDDITQKLMTVTYYPAN